MLYKCGFKALPGLGTGGWALVPAVLFLAFFSASGVELTAEQNENLPDFGNPEVAARLKCSACRGSAIEIHAALQDLRSLRKKVKIKEHEYTETLDKVCEDRIPKYGLQLRSNMPTQKFSKDAAISRAQGNWAGRYIMNVCSELVTDFEEAVLEHQRMDVPEFMATLCRDEAKFCNEANLKDISLGDEETLGAPGSEKAEL